MNTAMSKWTPLRDLEDFQNRIIGAFYPVLQRHESGRGERSSVTEWAPLADIVEDEDGYGITLELPDVQKEDVSVKVENGVLTITGERRKEKEVEGRRYHRVERARGCFSRSFIIPDDGDFSRIQAQFSEGLLRIDIAKSEAARPKQIEVQVE